MTYPFSHHETVRFSDCDPLGHANNATYLTFLEQARLALLHDFRDVILARVEIDFRSPVVAGDEVLIETRCAGVSKASFALDHRMTSGGRLVAEGTSVVVTYDYERGQSIPVSERVMTKLRLIGEGADEAAPSLASG